MGSELRIVVRVLIAYAFNEARGTPWTSETARGPQLPQLADLTGSVREVATDLGGAAARLVHVFRPR